MKKFSKLLIAAILFVVMPLLALTAFASGDGTQSSPYLISTADEFNSYSALVLSDNENYAGSYYKLTNNIDFSGKTLLPVGTPDAPFKGHLDGDGYAFLNVNFADTEYMGVVGYMTEGSIKNVSVSHVDVNGKKYINAYRIGVLVGAILPENSAEVVIDGCVTQGNFDFETTTHIYFGGMIGQINAKTNASVYVSDCESFVNAVVFSPKAMFGGGFVAKVQGGSGAAYLFERCISYGDIETSTSYAHAYAGSFAGEANFDESGWADWVSEGSLYAEPCNFRNCAALGNAKSTPAKASAYAYYGGFIACILNDVTTDNCYRNASQTLSGNNLCSAGISTSLSNLKSQSFLSEKLGLDFENKWYMTSLDSDAKLRTVAKSLGSAVMTDDLSVRLGEKLGVRYTSTIDTAKLDYVYEYGYIVARTSTLGENELTFDFSPIAFGVAYNSNEEIDIFWDKDDETVTFTGVLCNIKEKDYSSDYSARAYIKYVCCGETVIVYSDKTVSANISDVINSLENSGF